MLELLGAIWKSNPDMRLGQIISNALPLGRDPFYVEDDDMADRLRYLQQFLDIEPKP